MPEVPGNPFSEGANESVDAQKIALTQLLADQGALGAQQTQNRADNASALSGQQSAQNPAGYLYQTFERDASQAQGNQANELARIQAANAAYMDQVKAALPIHQKDTDAYYEALRKEYEDRQAERAQAMALARRAAGGGGGASKASIKLSETPVQQRTPSLATAGGIAGAQRDILSAAKAVGMDVGAAERRWVKGETGQFAEQDRALKQAIQVGMQTLIGQDATWAEVIAEGRNLANELGLSYEANIQPWLAMYSPMWGVADEEWLIPLAKGPSYAGSPTAKSASATKSSGGMAKQISSVFKSATKKK